ncbi:ComEC/Rec2 family competence protein, partial [Myxococcota bacterium]|nr:ComEC/Rec2 family competence protein [Myxococcota bacterium]
MGGALARLLQPTENTAFFGIVLLFLAALMLLFAWYKKRGILIFALLLFAALGAQRYLVTHTAGTNSTFSHSPARWRAEITGPISRFQDRGKIRQKVKLSLLAEKKGNKWQARSGEAELSLRAGTNVYRGDVIDLKMSILPRSPPRNPGDMTIEEALLKKLPQRARVHSTHMLVESHFHPLSYLDKARAKIAELFEEELDPEIATLAKAIGMGDRSGISPARREAWAQSGMAHLLAISGLHVGMVSFFFFFLARWILGSLRFITERSSARRLAAIFAIFPTLAFCLWAGAPISALRATIMAVMVLTGVAIGRPHAALNFLGLAGSALLLISPSSLEDVGFLLSFAAVAALLALPTPQRAENKIKRAFLWLAMALGA